MIRIIDGEMDLTAAETLEMIQNHATLRHPYHTYSSDLRGFNHHDRSQVCVY